MPLIIPSIPNNPGTIVNGQPADATAVIANFSAIVNAINANAASIYNQNVFALPQTAAAATAQAHLITALQVQSNPNYGVDVGVADAYVVNLAIPILAIAAGQRVSFLTANANTTTTPTLKVNGTTAYTICNKNGSTLSVGQITANTPWEVVFNSTLSKYQIEANASNVAAGSEPYADATGTADVITASYPNALPTLTDGYRLTVGIVTSNATTTPTFAPTIGGVLQTARVIIKFIGNVEVALAAGDLQGDADLRYDSINLKWILQNPALANAAVLIAISSTTAGNGVPVGTIIDFSAPAAPAGYLACPLVPTNISRVTYAALFNAIGNYWGAGDGVTTFGMPYFPADYSAVQANGNIATATTGQVIAHTHLQTVHAGTFIGLNSVGGAEPGNGGTDQTGSTGGSANLAAGMRVYKCVKV